MTSFEIVRQHSKLKRAETLREAQTFTVVRNHYAAAGLCPTCAAQAAYMHAHGAAVVGARCPGCPGGTQVWDRLPMRLQTDRSLRWLTAPDAEVGNAGGAA